MEREEIQSYESLQKKHQEKFVWFRLMLNSMTFGQSIIQVLALGSAMLFAAFDTVRGELTPGDYVLINMYIHQLFIPLYVSFYCQCIGHHRKRDHILSPMI